MLTKEKVLSILKQTKTSLQDKYHILNIGLFGSFAKNSATETSDIDIVIELDKPLGWAFFDIQYELEELFQRKVDLVTKAALHPALKENILKDCIFL